MANVYKNTNVQGTTSTGTYATLYNTTATTTAVVSTIAICNRSAADQTFRIGIMSSAGTPAAAEFIVYDAKVAANDSTFLTIGVSLGNTQYIRVSSSANTVSFSAFISEIVP